MVFLVVQEEMLCLLLVKTIKGLMEIIILCCHIINISRLISICRGDIIKCRIMRVRHLLQILCRRLNTIIRFMQMRGLILLELMMMIILDMVVILLMKGITIMEIHC